MRDGESHAACVDAWLARLADGQPAPVLVDMFDTALRALWDRTEVTLGHVTLSAIAHRVLHVAKEEFPMFSSLELEANDGISCRRLHERADELDSAVLTDGIRFVLLELLTVLGNLTADILTPELHAELSKVELRGAKS